MRRAAMALALAAFAVPAAAQQVAYEGSLSMTTGIYFFTERTTSWMLGSGLALTAGRVTLRTGIPVYTQNTTLVTRSGGGTTPTGGPMSGTVSDSGQGHHGGGGSGRMQIPVPESAVTGYEPVLGDPTAQLSVHLVNDVRTSLWVGAAVKFPLTDTSQYGTGEWDVSPTVSIMHWVGSAAFVSLDASYWYLGDLPDLELLDGIAVTAALGRRFGTAWVGSGWVSSGRAVLQGYDPPASVGLTLGRLGPALWSGSVGVGLTETVPDLSIGLSWRLGL